MNHAKIRFYPVGNGDTTLITLGDGTTIVVDLNARCAGEDDNQPDVFNVAEDLRFLAKEIQGRLHHDVFLITHLDNDHCLGFPKVFYTGDPASFDVDEDRDRIVIDELWFSPRLFNDAGDEEQLTEDATTLRDEARRRRLLHEKGDPARNEPGNRVRILGASEDVAPAFATVATGAGQTFQHVNGDAKDHFEVFVHGPFSEDSDKETTKRNNTSVILQLRFAVGGNRRAGLVLLGGDAESTVWNRVHRRTRDKDNLRWDLLLAPHHCSWTFFNEADKDEPADEEVLRILDLGNPKARVVASSKPILRNNDNPPSWKARRQYEQKIEGTVLCTGEEPDTKSPQPLTFEVTSGGVRSARRQSAVEVTIARRSPRLG